MRESLAECVSGIRSCLEVAQDALERKDWRRASTSARGLLSWAGKLNQRIGVMTDFLEEAVLQARATAEVDRALAKPAPIPGEQPLPFPVKGGPSKKGGRTVPKRDR